jgi:hypothetical protein
LRHVVIELVAENDMRTHIHGIDVEHGLARLGLFLAILLALLADRAYAEPMTSANRVSGFLARRAIDGIAAFGGLVDRLPQPNKGGRDEQTTDLRRWARGL